jgi:hypothetical protein
MRSFWVAALSAFFIPTAASADPITAFTLFAGNGAGLGSTVVINSGKVGSNNLMTVGNGSDTLVLTGAGALQVGSTVEIQSSSDIIFNGNVTIGNGTIHTGDIDSGGNVSIGSTVTVEGSIRAAGAVQLGNGTVVQGDIDAGAAAGNAVVLGNSLTQVQGTVTHKAGTNVVLNGGTVGGNVTGTPDTPTAYVPTVIPTATAFVAGLNPIGVGTNGVTIDIDPQSVNANQYSVANFGSTNTLNLTSGVYRFNTFNLGNGSILNLDVSGGGIQLLFAGNVSIGSTLTVNVTGGDASDVYAEVLGNFNLGNGSQWKGTVFGSGAGSDITFGSTTSLIGALYARDLLNIGNGSQVSLLASDLLVPPVDTSAVPEPASLVLLGTGLLAVARAHSRRKRK